MSEAQTLEKPVSMNTGTRPKFAVLRFPGANCDQDAYHVAKDVMGCPVEYVWHQDKSLKGFDVVVVPGGFSYGDYLRCGAVARFAPIMDAVVSHAERGGYVFGVCNGFQILCEAHLLPGALMRNVDCKFLCQYVHLRVENRETPFTSAYREKQVLKIPIAHGEGRYQCDVETLDELERERRVVFRYVSAKGETTEEGNPNGSLASIAGIANKGFNVVGMMPHPERACERILGSDDGKGLFASVIEAVMKGNS
jgi:phosphoribosylformylglycinamidine synthase